MITGILIIIGIFFAVWYIGIVDLDGTVLKVSDDFSSTETIFKIKEATDNFIDSLRQLG